MNHDGQPYNWSTDDFRYWQNDPLVTDPETGYVERFSLMQALINRRELFNDSDNPVHKTDFTPILGENGWGEEYGSKINNIDNIHAKLGWHNQEVIKASYYGPDDLLIYYGWLNPFNSGTNLFNNELVAQDIARYDMCVFGDGLQNPAHGDYANTQIIISRIKAINPAVLIFGYVTTNQLLSSFETKADQWNTLGVHGIFMDESGYDYSKTRTEFNERVDYVHSLTDANLCFANAWDTDHILGTANDPSYPNSTYNSSLAESNLTVNDWILLESLAVNTSSYSGNDGYEDRAQWALRSAKATSLRANYGVNFAGVSIINNDNAEGNTLYHFCYASSLMLSLEAFGTSDTSYGSGSATVKKWSKPDVKGLKPIWNINPSIQSDLSDTDVYIRHMDNGKLELDFSAGEQKSAVYPPPGNIVENYGYIDFVSESSKTVEFNNEYVDDVICIQLTPGANINCWVASVNTSDFTVNLSTSWTGRVYWFAKGT